MRWLCWPAIASHTDGPSFPLRPPSAARAAFPASWRAVSARTLAPMIPADPASTVNAVVEGHHPYLVRGRFRPLSSLRIHTDRSNLKSRVRKLGNRNGPMSFRVRLVPSARLDSLRRSGDSKTGRLCSSFSVSSKKAIVGTTAPVANCNEVSCFTSVAPATFREQSNFYYGDAPEYVEAVHRQRSTGQSMGVYLRRRLSISSRSFSA